MNWQEFINWLLDNELRLSTVDVENLTGIKNPIIYRWKEGSVGKPQRSTIKRLEDGLGIKIDDRDPENITYKKVKETKVGGFEGEIPVTKIPLLSEVYAGEPQYLDTEYHDEYHFFVNMKPNHRCFALRVSGKSMETTLKDGAIVVVDMDAEYKDGDIVAVRLKNGEQYIKRFYDMNYAFIKLTSDNSDYGVRLIDKEHIDKIYKVASAIFDPNER
jgi:phage repressor protein C with HTH and peptisase S24 domain